ncbi:MAG: hypothetical protein IMX01_06290 [Limnochordaceae bacterium]|nr:hypothetical protein [Limnochordaceae bacterium]
MRWQFAAVQAGVNVEDYRTEEQFRRKICRLLDQVRSQAGTDPSLPLLVAFPEDIGTPLAFVDDPVVVQQESTLRGAVTAMVRRHMWAAAWRRLRHRVGWVRALFLLQADRMARIYFSVFAQAARDYQAYIVAGSVVLPDLGPDWGGVYLAADAEHARAQGKQRTLSSQPDEAERGGDPELDLGTGKDQRSVYNVSYTFDLHGRVLGFQRKVHMVEQEAPGRLDLVPGRLHDIRALALPGLSVGVAICYDGFFTDVRASLRQDGASVLVQPSANPGPWTPEQQLDWLRGAWTATLRPQDAPYELQPGCGFAAAINPMLVGRLFDVRFEGQSSILLAHGPERSPEALQTVGVSRDGARPSPQYQAVQGRPGFLAVAEKADDEQVLVATVSLPERQEDPFTSDLPGQVVDSQ